MMLAYLVAQWKTWNARLLFGGWPCGALTSPGKDPDAWYAPMGGR